MFIYCSGSGTHVHVLSAWQPALAGPEGGHVEGALPEDRRHQEGNPHRGNVISKSKKKE